MSAEKVIPEKSKGAGRQGIPGIFRRIVSRIAAHRLPVLIFFIALTVRIFYFYQIKDDFFFQTPILDARYYDDWAGEIATTGDWLSESRGLFVMSPGYSYFLAIMYTLVGRHSSLIALIQFFLGSASCVLTFLIARKVLPPRPHSLRAGDKNREEIPAFISGLLLAGYGISIFYEGILVKSALINFLNLLMLYLLIIGREKNSWTYYLPAGLCLGYSVHLRPNIIAFIFFIIVLYFMKERGESMASPAPTLSDKEMHASHAGKSRRTVLTFIMFFVGVLIVLLPVGFRNYHVGRQFVLTTAHGGMNFYTGNNPRSFGPYTPLSFARTDPQSEIEDFFAEAQRRAGHALTTGEADRLWFQESWKFIREQPRTWVALLWRKALIFFNDYEQPINLNYYAFRQVYRSIISMPLLTYGILAPLGLWGMILYGWKNYVSRLLTSYIICYFLVSVVFFVVSEYRYPVVAAFAIFAGHGIYWFFEKSNAKRYALKAFGVLFLSLTIWISNKDIYKDWFGLKTYQESILADAYYSMGTVYADHGMVDKAKEFFYESIKTLPLPGSFLRLGDLFAGEGKLEDAKQLYQYALRIDPRSFEAYRSLGKIYYRQNNYQEAERSFQQADMVESQLRNQ